MLTTRRSKRRTSPRTVLGAVALAVIALAATVGTAGAKPGNSIDHDRGIGGVNLGLRRGPLAVRRGKRVRVLHTVNSILGKPQSVHALPRDEGDTPEEREIYLANYTDDALSVYYQMRNRKGELDKKRDANDRVVGVVTYSSRYVGTPGVGQAFPDSEAAGPCAPLDKHVAPDGGPRRALACLYDPGGSEQALDIVYMSVDGSSRAAQTIMQLAVFNRTVGTVIFQSIMAGALADLDCKTVSCNP